MYKVEVPKLEPHAILQYGTIPPMQIQGGFPPSPLETDLRLTRTRLLTEGVGGLVQFQQGLSEANPDLGNLVAVECRPDIRDNLAQRYEFPMRVKYFEPGELSPNMTYEKIAKLASARQQLFTLAEQLKFVDLHENTPSIQGVRETPDTFEGKTRDQSVRLSSDLNTIYTDLGDLSYTAGTTQAEEGFRKIVELVWAVSVLEGTYIEAVDPPDTGITHLPFKREMYEKMVEKIIKDLEAFGVMVTGEVNPAIIPAHDPEALAIFLSRKN